MPTPEIHDHRGEASHELSEVLTYRRARRRGGHRAGAVVTGVLLLSGLGAGAAYGVTASASRAPARDLALAHATLPARTASMHTLPVKARSVVVASDLDVRVTGLVADATRIVAEKLEAERRASEEAQKAAWAAQQKAAADAAAANGAKSDGGCSGKHGGY